MNDLNYYLTIIIETFTNCLLVVAYFSVILLIALSFTVGLMWLVLKVV